MSKPGEQIYVHEQLDSVEGDATEYIRGDIVEAIRQQVRDGENARTELEAEVERLQEKCFNDAMAAKKSGYEEGRVEADRLQASYEARGQRIKELAVICEKLEAKAKRLRNHFHIPSLAVTQIPCARCRGPVIEFVIPNEIWNLIIRHRGPEGSGEYLCYDCFLLAAGEKVERLQEIVGQIPKDADGDPIEDCKSYFFPCANGVLEFVAYLGPRCTGDVTSPYPWSKAHKTQEAIENAADAAEGGS